MIISSGAFLFLGSGTASASLGADDDAPQILTPTMDLSPLNRFIVNEGQWTSAVNFATTTNFGSAAFATDGFQYYLPGSGNTTEIVSFKFVGANTVTPTGIAKQSSTSNYLLGSDSSAWRTGVAEYAGILYSDLWNGIDMVFFFVDGELKYELTVAAGVSSDSIAVRVSGAAISVHDGDLVISTANNSIVDSGLLAYYADDHAPVDASFAVSGDMYSFKLARDISRAIAIDPLVYSTYLGGGNRDEGTSIAVDPSGCVYVTGYAASIDFPISDGAYQAVINVYSDAFITKLNADGSLAYSTYLGGSNLDSGSSIAVDSSGCAYMTGYTNSRDFPITEGAAQTNYGGDNYDAFITKLGPTGSLAYSTYLGGSNYDMGNSIAVDPSGCAYVTGVTWSGAVWPWGFPLTDGAYQTTKGDQQDAYVTKLSADGSEIVYSTFLGGDDTDIGFGIAVDLSGCAHLTGYTYSTNFPTTDGAFQSYPGDGKINAFVTKIDTDGSDLVYSTYLGGSGHEIGFGIAVDSSGCAHVSGHTTSTDFPTHNAFQPSRVEGYDAFVTKISADGSALVYSTYLGGRGDEGYSTSDYQLDIAVDPSGLAYVAGFTSSTDFNVTSGAYQTANSGSYDAFVAMFDPAGDLAYSTYLGGSDSDYGHGIALGLYGCVYVTGRSLSSNFPVTDGAHQSFLGGKWVSDAFVTKLSLVPGTPCSLTAIPGQTNVSLFWSAPIKSDSEIVGGYIVYQDGVKIAETTSRSIVVTGLVSDQEYEFSVLAQNMHGYGPKAIISATPAIYVTVGASASLQYVNADTAASFAVDISAESELSLIELVSGNVSHNINGIMVNNEPISVAGNAYSDVLSPPLTVEGVHVLTYTFNDSVGNSISKSVTVIYDTTEPAVAIESPIDYALISTSSVLVSWTVNDGLSGMAKVEYSTGGTNWMTVTDSGIALMFDDGSHTIFVRATDNAGNQNTASASFTVDTALPTVEIFSPADGSFNNTGSITVRWVTDDATSGIKAVEFSTDGVTWTDADGATSYDWSGLSDGAHTFHVKAEDWAGHVEVITLDLTVDAVSPTIAIDRPSNNSLNNTGIVRVSWTADDDRTGLDYLEVSMDGSEPLILGLEIKEYTFNGLPDGLHRVTITAVDRAGNKAMDEVAFTVDTVGPVLDLLSPTDGAFNNTGSVIIQWTADDATSDLAAVEYSTDGTTWTVTSGGSFTWSDLADGAYTFYLRAEDNVGHTATDEVSFTVDTQSPSVAIVTPGQGAWYNSSSLLLSWTSSDDVALAPYHWIMVDGREWINVTTANHELRGLVDGEHTVMIRAFDLAGNHADYECTFNIELVMPGISVIAPTDSSYNVTGEVRAQWIGSAASGIANYWVRLDGGDWINADLGTDHLFEVLTDGEHAVTVKAQSMAGNWNEASIGFIVDSVAPTMSGTPTGSEAAIDKAIEMMFSEAMNRTATIVTINDVVADLEWSDNVATIRSVQLSYGTSYQIVVSGQDLAGNELASSWSFTTMKDEGTISGIVKDKNGNAVVGATVTLGDMTTMTDDNGCFVLRNVTSGTYDITVKMEGYETITESATVSAGAISDIGTLSLKGITDNGALVLVTIVAITAALLAAALLLVRKRA